MRNLKKILALVVVFALAISMMASAVSFTDVPGGKTGDTNKIGLISQLGIIKGYPSADGKTFAFRPDANITRAEMATIIYRTLTGDVANANFKAKTDFPDVTENDWFGGYVKYATALEPSVILGRTNGKFDPYANVTVAEAATMLVRALGYDKMVSLEAGVAKACELGILSTAAGADAAATRGQVADMVYNAMFNKYLRNSTTVLGSTVAPTLAYAVFKIAPFDAVVLGSASGKVDLAVIEAYDGYSFSVDFYDWFMSYNNLVGRPWFTYSGVSYAGMDNYVGYSVRLFAKDLNGNGKYDVYDSVSYMYVSPKNTVLEGDMTKFDSQSGTNERVANGKFAFDGKLWYYDTDADEDEPIFSYENGRLIGYGFGNDYTADFHAYANPGMTIEAYIEKFMNAGAYAKFRMIDNDGDGKVEFVWYDFTGSAYYADTLSTGYVVFGNIDNTMEKVVDWGRDYPKFTANYDLTTSIKAEDVKLASDVTPYSYVHITPMWNGSKYTYTLEKATTVSGKLSAVSSDGQGKIEIDGKAYSMANTLYLYNYPGYAANFTIDAGPYSGFYGMNNSVNLGKYFTIVLNKAGYVWRVEKYTPATTPTKGHYGIITDVATSAVNLKAGDPFASPVWTIQVKMTNENGENKVYNTTVTSTTDPLYALLTARKNVAFVEYSLNADGAIVVADTVLDPDTSAVVAPQKPIVDSLWTNLMSSQATTFNYSATTKYFTREGFSTANGDLKYKVDENTVIFSFVDIDNDGVKDANEPVSVVKAADLEDLRNAIVYADDSVYYSAGIDYLKAIVIRNAPALASQHIGWYVRQSSTIDANGNWTYTFIEHNGQKTYTSKLNIPQSWEQHFGDTFMLYMYTVDADGNIVYFMPFANGDFTRAPSDIGEGVYFTVQLFDYATIDANTLDLTLAIDVKNPMDPSTTMTTIANALLTDDSKVYILKTRGAAYYGWNAYTTPLPKDISTYHINEEPYRAKSSAADPFYDFHRWTGFYAGTLLDLSATEHDKYNNSGDYYQFGWAKFTLENGQLVIAELYLFDEPLGTTAPNAADDWR